MKDFYKTLTSYEEQSFSKNKFSLNFFKEEEKISPFISGMTIQWQSGIKNLRLKNLYRITTKILFIKFL